MAPRQVGHEVPAGAGAAASGAVSVGPWAVANGSASVPPGNRSAMTASSRAWAAEAAAVGAIIKNLVSIKSRPCHVIERPRATMDPMDRPSLAARLAVYSIAKKMGETKWVGQTGLPEPFAYDDKQIFAEIDRQAVKVIKEAEDNGGEMEAAKAKKIIANAEGAENGVSLLYWAIYTQRNPVLQKLLELGANPKAVSNLSKDDKRLLGLEIEEMARTEVRYFNPRTPLEYAEIRRDKIVNRARRIPGMEQQITNAAAAVRFLTVPSGGNSGADFVTSPPVSTDASLLEEAYEKIELAGVIRLEENAKNAEGIIQWAKDIEEYFEDEEKWPFFMNGIISAEEMGGGWDEIEDALIAIKEATGFSLSAQKY